MPGSASIRYMGIDWVGNGPFFMTWRAVFCNLSRFYDGHSGSRGGAGPEHGVGGLKIGSLPMPVTAGISIWGLTGLGTDPFLSPPRAPEGLKRLRGFAERAPPRPRGGRAAAPHSAAVRCGLQSH